MHVIAQSRIWQELNYEHFLSVLRQYGKVTEVQIIPFTDVIEPECNEAPDIVLGSGRLVEIAKKRGWPTFESFTPRLDDIVDAKYLLNGNPTQTTIKELSDLQSRTVFVKPMREKLFTGLVLDIDGLQSKAFDSLVQCSTTGVDELGEEIVFVSDPISIQDEFRFFVFNNRIATGSSYGKDKKVYQRILADHFLWGLTQDVINSFHREITGTVDVTLHQGEIRIIELNNLNSAGIYEADPHAIAQGLQHFIR